MKFCMKCMGQYEDSFNICPVCGFAEGTLPTDSRCLEPGYILAERYIVGMPRNIDGWLIEYISWDALNERRAVIYEYCPNRYASRMIGETKVNAVKEAAFNKYKALLTRKAKLLSSLHIGENISTVYECFEANNTAYVVCEYVEGQSLADYIKAQAPMSPQSIEKMMLPILRALDELHENGYIIGGFSPYSFCVRDDNTLVLSSFLDSIFFNITDEPGDIKNTEAENFYPYERLKTFESPDIIPANDVYSAAMVMYAMLGVPIPAQSERFETYSKKHKDKLKTPGQCKIKLDKSKQNALINAVAIEPEGRTPNMEELIKELTGEKEVTLRSKRGKKFPLWAKIAIPAGAVAAGVGIYFLVAPLKSPVTDELKTGQTIVPSLVNCTYDQASNELAKAGLMIELEGREIDDEAPEGQVVSQSVAKGTLVDENTVIGVKITARSGDITMPNFLGFDLSTCREALENLGLNYSITEEYSNIIDKGCVVYQSIAPYEVVRAGQRVELRVSLGRDPSVGHEVKSYEAEDLSGKTYEELLEYAEDGDIPVEVTERVFDDSVPEGTVLEQYPPAGSASNNEEGYTVVVSTANTEVTVPDLTLIECEKAKSIAQYFGLKVEIATESSESVDEGLVISHMPAAGAKANIGDTVTLTASTGRTKVTMPDVIGKSREEAADEMRRAGIAAKYSYETDKSKKQDTITRQSIIGGAEVEPGSGVLLTVCTHKELVAVPDITGMDRAKAEETLKNAGLKLKIYTDAENTAESGAVYAQSPEPSLYVPKGDDVTVVLREGGGSEITLSPESVTLEPKDEFELRIECRGIEDLYSVEYDISNESVVYASYVDKSELANGVIKMKFKASQSGSADIKISLPSLGLEKTCTVTVI